MWGRKKDTEEQVKAEPRIVPKAIPVAKLREEIAESDVVEEEEVEEPRAVQKKKRKKIIVVRELPTQQISGYTDPKTGEEVELITIEDALTKIMNEM